MLIGTAVVGATTMVFGIIMLLQKKFELQVASGVPGPFKAVVEALSIVRPEVILGLIMGGSVIYWFTGASCQAVVTGAYRAVVYIKENMKLDASTASDKDSKEVVRICTEYAQKGMWNIFIVVFCFALALPFFNPYFFIGYLIGIAFFGLFQAIFMANAGGAWDNAKKIVEVDLRQKGTPLHAATVVGDTVGDPFKDTSSVAMNPVIKFTTLFGLLAVEIAVTMTGISFCPPAKRSTRVMNFFNRHGRQNSDRLSGAPRRNRVESYGHTGLTDSPLTEHGDGAMPATSASGCAG